MSLGISKRMFLTPHRKLAGKKLLFGTGAFVAAMALIFIRSRNGSLSNTDSVYFKIFAVAFFAMLIAALRPFFEGLIGFVFGVPVGEFTAMVNSKPWWYRLIVGVFLIVITVAIFLYGLGYTLIWVCNVLS